MVKTNTETMPAISTQFTLPSSCTDFHRTNIGGNASSTLVGSGRSRALRRELRSGVRVRAS